MANSPYCKGRPHRRYEVLPINKGQVLVGICLRCGGKKTYPPQSFGGIFNTALDSNPIVNLEWRER